MPLDRDKLEQIDRQQASQQQTSKPAASTSQTGAGSTGASNKMLDYKMARSSNYNGPSVRRKQQSSGTVQTSTSLFGNTQGIRAGATPTNSIGAMGSISGRDRLAGQTQQDMSVYQGNMYSPTPASQPTYRGAMADVYRLNQTDPAAAYNIYNQLQNSQFDPSSQYYNPYAGVTNRAAQAMQALGFDVSNIDDNWFQQNSWLKQYYVPTANTNSLSTTMTNKKSTPEQQAAYYYNQLYMANEDTKKAQRETDALEQELKYWASRKDLNYSDDQIVGMINWSKYPTLSKMDSTRMAGTPMELNTPIRYSKDWMYGTLWAARNGGGTGNSTSDMINSVLGVGNTWKDDEKIRQKLNRGNPNTYSPYSVSSTMYDECCYFGVSSFSQRWVDENYERIVNSGDQTAIKMLGNVMDAIEYTETLESELSEMNKRIDELLAGGVTNPDIILRQIKDNTKYKDLYALDDTMSKPGVALKKTAWAVDYRMRDVEARVRQGCKDNENKTTEDKIIADAQDITFPFLTGDVKSYEEMQKELLEEEKRIEGGGAAEKPDEKKETGTEQPASQTAEPTPEATAEPSPSPSPSPYPPSESEPGGGTSEAEPDPIGRYGKGNIDLFNRPVYTDDDGNIETVKSLSFYDEDSGKAILIPTIIDGKAVTDDEAIDHYRETGEFLGMFESIDEADEYAAELDLQQERLYAGVDEEETFEEPEAPAAEAPAQTEPAPVMSEAEKEAAKQEKANLDDVTPIIMVKGTPAEKTAVRTVGVMERQYNQFLNYFRTIHPEAGEKWLYSTATKNLVGNYFNEYGVIYNYNKMQGQRDEAQAELDGNEERWKELGKNSIDTASLGLTGDQYINLENSITESDMPDLDKLQTDVDIGEASPAELTMAQLELYFRVTGDDSVFQYDPDTQEDRAMKAELAQLWWDYYTSDVILSPIDYMERRAGILHANDGGDVSETLRAPDGSMMELHFSPEDGGGPFELDYAIDANGNRLSPEEVHAIYDEQDYVPLTYEEEMELAALDERREELKAQIDEADAYLADNKAPYTQAMGQKEALEKSYIMGAFLYGQDLNLLYNMDELYSAGTDASPIYPIGDILEYYVSNGEMSEEDAAFYERMVSKARGDQATRLENLLNTMDRMGIPVPDEMRQNVLTRIDELQRDSEASAYALLDNKGDFSRVVDETKNKALAGDYGELAQDIAKRSDRSSEEYTTGNEAADVLLSDATALLTLGSTIDTKTRVNAIENQKLNALRSKEVNRYLYLLGTEGKDAADKYWNMLDDEDSGYLSARRRSNLSRIALEYASKGIPQAILSTGISLGTNFVAGPVAGAYEVKTYLQGKSINPSNPALDWLYLTSSMRLGSEVAIANLGGGPESTFGEVSKFIYELGTNVADFMLKRGAVKEVFAFGMDKLSSMATDIMSENASHIAADLSYDISVAADAAARAAKYSKVLDISKRTFNVAVAGAIAQNRAAGHWVKVVTENDATPDEALATSSIVFVGNTLAYSFVIGNLNKYLQKGVDAAPVSEFVKDLYVNGLGHAVTAGLATKIEQEADKQILKEKSDYALRKQQLYEEYKGKYPKAIAEKMATDQANEEAWNNIVVNAGLGGLSSIIITSAGYASQLASKNRFNFWRGKKAEKTQPANEEPSNGLPYNDVPKIGENTQEWDTPADEPIDIVVNGESTGGDTGLIVPGTGNGGTESGGDIIPYAGPSQAAVDAAQATTDMNMGLFARDQAMLAHGMGDVTPSGEAFTIDGVLGLSGLNPDPNATRAASQNLVGNKEFADGRVRLASSVLSQIELVVPEQNLDMIKWDLTQAAVVPGSEGANALSGIFYKVGQGERITPEDVQAVSDGVARDKANDPNFSERITNAIRDSRIAIEMARTFMSGAFKSAVQSVADAVKQAAENEQRAEKILEEAEADMKSAEEELKTATENQMEDPLDPALNAPVEQALNKLEAAAANLDQQQDAVKDANNNLEEAKAKQRDVEAEQLNQIRSEAAAKVDQEIASENAAKADAQAVMDNAATEAQAMAAEETAKAAAERTQYEGFVRQALSGSRLSGGQIETTVQRAMTRRDELLRGKVDMSALISSAEGEKFLNYLSDKTGFNIERRDLGDPRVIRGKNIGGNTLLLNERLSTGQALVEATFHEMIHGLESTPAYKPFSDAVADILFKGNDTPAYKAAIKQKKLDYAANGIHLENDDAARREIVADFGRTHLASKKLLKKIVNAGAGPTVKKYVRAAWQSLKGYRLDPEGTAERRKLQKAERLLQQMLDQRAQMIRDGYKGHTGITQFSVQSVADAAGLELIVNDNDTVMYQLKYKGKTVKPGGFKPDMVKDTPVGKLIDLGTERKKQMLQNRYETGDIWKENYTAKLAEVDEKANQQRQFVADILNMISKYQDAAMVWELVGSHVFSTLKTNGDPQYSDSDDMGSVCTKTQAILNTMSTTQLKLGRALTKEEIDGIVYEEVGKGVQNKDGTWKHGATPCPPCYVFATWVNKPARLEMVRQFQIDTANWTDDDINEFMDAPAPVPVKGKLSKAKADKLKSAQNAKKLWIKLCLADEHKDGDKTTYTRKAKPDICPNEILLDLRRSGDMAKHHPGTWTFMQKGGNAVGKAISEYTDSRLGETIIGKAVGAGKLNEMVMADARNEGNPDYVPQFINPFLIMNDTEADRKAKDYFDRAVEKMKAQNLMGGQRWQSWSDFRAEWGSDYLMEMLTMDALGAKVQTYTKVHEALDLLASAGFEVNMSLMPDGDGFWHNEDGSIAVDEDGNLKLKFSKVTGINPDAAEEAAKKHGTTGNVQPMVVGISDQHILAALAGDYITFVIPFHGSGGSVKRLQHLMLLLKETMKSGYDYTKAQSDKFEHFEKVDRGEGDEDLPTEEGEDSGKKKENTNPIWKLRVNIITGKYSNGITDEEESLISGNEYLQKLYNDRYVDQTSEAYHVFFSNSKAQQIYPYEYWDTNTTLATADRNSERFCSYCQMLGVIPRFSGLTRTAGKNKHFKPTEYGIAIELDKERGTNTVKYDSKGRVIEFEYANFSGRRVDENGNVSYHPVKGYWKLLIDRNMYNRVYGEDGKLIKDKCTYHQQKPVDVTNVSVGAMPMSANNTVGHKEDEYEAIAERCVQRILLGSGQNKAAGSAVDMKENEKIIQDAMYGGSNVQLCAGGDLSVSDIDILLAEADQKYQEAVKAGDEKEAQKYINQAAELAGYDEFWAHGSPRASFTRFDLKQAKNAKAVFLSDPSTASQYAGTGYQPVPLNLINQEVKTLDDALAEIKRLSPGFGEPRKVDGGYKINTGRYARWMPMKLVYSDEDVIRYANVLREFNKGGVYYLYVNPGSKLTMDANGAWWDRINSPYGRTTDQIGEWARTHGYDSLEIQNVHDGGFNDAIPSDILLVFDPNRIKSANITYDKDGNPISLLDRFDRFNPDIRYSVGGELTDADIDTILADADQEYLDVVESGDMDRAQEMVDLAADDAGYTLTAYHGTGEYFNVFQLGEEGIHIGNKEQAENVAELRFEWRSKWTRYDWGDVRDHVDSMDEEQRESLAKAAYLESDYFNDGKPVYPYDGDIFDTAALTAYVDDIFSRAAKFYKMDPDKVNFQMRTFDRKTDRHLMKLRARVQNPFVVNGDIGSWTPHHIAMMILDKAAGVSWADRDIDILSGSEINLNDDQREKLTDLSDNKYKGDQAWKVLSDVLSQSGFDGIKYLNTYEGDRNSYSWLVMNRSQVKLADAVTYDDYGEPIPLSARFNDWDPDTRYAAGGELTDADVDQLLDEADKKYLAAVDAGDMVAAQAAVDQAAMQSFPNSKLIQDGKFIKMWHHSNAQFSEFMPGTSNGPGGIKGIFFTPNEYGSVSSAGKEYHNQYYLNAENIAFAFGVPKDKPYIEELRRRQEGVTDSEELARINREFSEETGIDAIFDWQNGWYTMLNPEDIKSAAPVTYDDEGNPVPLSERFKHGNPDIRHSIGGDFTDAEIDQLLVDSGLITPEMVPYSYVPGRRTGSGNGPYRQFGRYRAPESNALHDEVKEYLYNNSEYTPVRNRDQVDGAIAWVQGFANDNDPTGYYGALREVESPTFEFRTADAQVKMLTVMSMAALRAEKGDPAALADERRVTQAYNKQGTPLAQMLQARKLFRIMTPLGRMSVLEGMVDNINEELRRKGKRANTKSGQVELDDDLLERAAHARRPKDFDRVRKQARKKIAEQIPPDWKDKLRAFRYMSMLLNPRTHVRNILGNFFFIPAVGIKNKIGAMIELSQKPGHRTKTLRMVLPKDIKDFVNQDAEEQKDLLTGTAKYDDRTEIDRERRIFNSWLHYVYKFSSDSLEWEDWKFLKGHYRRALGGWIVANNYTIEQLQNDPTLLEQGRKYAIEEAQKATYRDFNSLADRLAKFAQSPKDPRDIKAKAGAFIVNAAIPFKKTPANILSRAMEYSIFGLTRSLTTDAKRMLDYLKWQEAMQATGGGGNGQLPPNPPGGTGNPPADRVPPTPPEGSITPNEWIDKLCAGLTGTGIMVVGAILASLGYITVKLEKEEKDIEEAKGNQQYSLKINLFGKEITYTLDWLAPMCMPFFTGAFVQQIMCDAEGWEWRDVINALASIADPITNMSMLEGIGNVLRTSANSGISTVSEIAGNILANYATSFVPSVVGAIARIVDPYRRMVFLPSGHSSDFAGSFEYAFEQVQNKIPGLSQQNIPYRDIWGNVDERTDLERVIENFISPGCWREYRQDDPVSDELSRLYALVPDESSLIPKFPTKKIGGLVLTDKQWDDYRVVRNSTAYIELDRVFNSSYYKELDPTEQAAQVKKVWEYCSGIGKLAVFPNMTVDNWITATEDPIGTMIRTGDMFSALETESYESYNDIVYMLKNEDGLTDKDIKSKLGTRYRDRYKDAYRDYLRSGSNEAFQKMIDIEEMLMLSGYDFNIHGKDGWESKVDEEQYK